MDYSKGSDYIYRESEVRVFSTKFFSSVVNTGPYCLISMVIMRVKFCLWVHTICVLTVIVAKASPDNLYVYGTYDLDKDGLSEILLFAPQARNVPVLRYVELDMDGNHHHVWSLEQNEIEGIINNVVIADLVNNGAQDLVISTRTMKPKTESTLSIVGFRWSDSTFVESSLSINYDIVDGDRFRVTHATYSHVRETIAMTVSSPAREVVILRIEEMNKNLNLTVSKQLSPASLKNGYGKIYAEWLGPVNAPHLVIFSEENEALKVDIFDPDQALEPVGSGYFTLRGDQGLIAPAILAVDLNKDGVEELLLPFQNDEVWSLAYTEGILTLDSTMFSGSSLFNLKEEASAQEINLLLLARIEAGLYESDYGFQSTADLLDSLEIAVSDTVLVGDTVSVQATPSSAGGFYSFQWHRKPSVNANYNPHTGLITWIPRDEDIGSHILSYGFQVRLREELQEEEDAFGNKLQIVPVLVAGDTIRAVVVLDSTKSIPPPIIHPPFPRRLYTVSASTNYSDEENRFLFEGTPSFSLSTDVIPGRTGLRHTISTNLSTLPRGVETSFTYEMPEIKNKAVATLSMIHDMKSNVLFVAVDPALDSVPQSFYPGDWDKELYAYPEYLFKGFTTDLIMDSASGSIVFYPSGREENLDFPFTWVELSSPSRPDHVSRIYYDQGALQRIHGTVNFNEDGTAKTITRVEFSDNFDPLLMVTNVIHTEDDSIRARAIPAVILEDQTAPVDAPLNSQNKPGTSGS